MARSSAIAGVKALHFFLCDWHDSCERCSKWLAMINVFPHGDANGLCLPVESTDFAIATVQMASSWQHFAKSHDQCCCDCYKDGNLAASCWKFNISIVMLNSIKRNGLQDFKSWYATFGKMADHVQHQSLQWRNWLRGNVLIRWKPDSQRA